MVNKFVVYTPTTALTYSVETVYCHACTNTHGRIGPDLGRYGIFNWNNKMGFSHLLLNSFTSAITHGETPFNAFYLHIKDQYLDTQSPVEFCDGEIFEYAWFAFIHLQEIQSSMVCSRCGPNPKVVIADGISVSFPSHHRTEGLRPPTVPDKDHAWVRLRKSATRNTTLEPSQYSPFTIYTYNARVKGTKIIVLILIVLPLMRSSKSPRSTRIILIATDNSFYKFSPAIACCN
jgi:hypothetical protein